MKMKGHDKGPILVTEWGYPGKGKFQRRDFRLETQTGRASWEKNGNVLEASAKWEDRGMDPIFQPEPTKYRKMTVKELAERARSARATEGA
jgi:hypothetical protein